MFPTKRAVLPVLDKPGKKVVNILYDDYNSFMKLPPDIAG